MRLPNQRFSVACLCNAGPVNTEELVQRVAHVQLDVQFPEPSPHRGAAAGVAAPDLHRFAGLYWNPETDAFVRVTLRDGSLFSGFVSGRETALTPLGGSRFRPANQATVWEFTPVPATGGAALVLRPSSGPPDTLKWVETQSPRAGALADYVGVYTSEELDPAFRVSLDGERIVLRRLKAEPATLVPVAPDAFVLPIGTWRFFRDANGRVTGATLNGGRIRNVRFRRVSS